MSFKNYIINNYSNNQPITQQDLNTLSTNDIILYNKIFNMPRGVLAFDEIRSAHSSFNTFTPTASTDNVNQGFRFIKKSGGSTENDVFKLTFSAEDLRLLRFNFFTSFFSNSTGSFPYAGRAKFAFFIEQNNGDRFMLNTAYKTSAMTSSSLHGSVSMSTIATVPAGTHVVKVGIKAHKATIVLGSSGDLAVRRPTQLYVEDLGSFVAEGEEIVYEL
jgi:hypothetical protein